MKFVHFESPGPPEVLKIKESKIPTPSNNEILIKVVAAGVNRPDLMQREGNYPAPKGHSTVLGLEVSGTIQELGNDVTAFKEGDNVCALLDGGGYAEYCIAKAKQVIKFPENLSFIEAAALPECFMTCWSNIVDRGEIKENQNVLIHGGSSGIGTTAIQILKMFNANIFTTVGNELKKKKCEELGANLVINYNEDDFFKVIKEKTAKDGINLILDMVGGEYVQKNIDLLSNDGKLINIAYQKGSITELNLIKVMLKRLVITGSTLRVRDENFKGNILKDLEMQVFPKIKSGLIKPIIDSVYDLNDVIKAHTRLYKNKHIGKIVLSV